MVVPLITSRAGMVLDLTFKGRWLTKQTYGSARDMLAVIVAAHKGMFLRIDKNKGELGRRRGILE